MKALNLLFFKKTNYNEKPALQKKIPPTNYLTLYIQHALTRASQTNTKNNKKYLE